MNLATRTRLCHALVWLCWFVALLGLTSVYHLPVERWNAAGGVQLALPVASEMASPAIEPQELFPWLPGGRWRKWAWRRYQVARQVWQRAVWAARLKYYRAVGVAHLAQLLMSGVISLAALVDLLTRAQLRRNLGALPVLYTVLEVLQVKEIINRYCPSEAEVEHGIVAVALILNRLTAPRPLVRVADWVAQTVLVHTLGVPAAKFNDDRLGRTLDAISQHQREIWLDIVNQALLRFDVDLSVIFYDLTAFVMQGKRPDSDLSDYGFAHNTPSDKPKVKQGLDVAGDGNVPLEAATLNGRTADLATVQENMERLCRLLKRCGYPLEQALIIGDRGTLNDEIALKYDEKNLKYLAGLKAQRKEHAELLTAIPEAQFRAHPLSDERGRYGLYGLPCQIHFTHAGKTVTHRGLVVISGPMRHAVRQARAAHLRALRAELSTVRAKIGRPQYRTVAQVQARAETCLRHSPVGKLMRVEAKTSDGRVDLRWWIDTHALWQAMQRDGRYLLSTNDLSLTPRAMMDMYRAKDGVEKCFRVEKQFLKVRPIYVHSDERIQAMLLINMLALLVYSLLERELRQKGLPLTTRRLIEQLESLTVIETECVDGSVLCRLTPVSEDQRQLMIFLAGLVAELRLPRFQPALPQRPTAPGLLLPLPRPPELLSTREAAA
jgi:transposase